MLPLIGIRVLDMTRALSGPYCTMILGDMGAEVVKVEGLPDGDLLRAWGPFVQGESTYYLCTNRNKRSIAVDLRQPQGIELVRHLARSCDVLVENFRVGVMAQMGLSYETLSAQNPKLIYASITGFGRGGPYERWPGFDQIAQGMSGLMSLTGSPESGPTRVGIPIGDLSSALWTVCGILGALVSRASTGHGQRVETSLLASLVSLLSFQGQQYLSTGRVPEPTGLDHPALAPYGAFRTASGLLSIAPATEPMWKALCHELELEELTTDPNFCSNTARVAHRSALKLILESRLRSQTAQYWVPRLTEAGIPAGPIWNLEQVFNDPHVIATQCVTSVQHPTVGKLQQLTNPVRWPDLVARPHLRAPPRLGEHTREICRDHGVSAEKIDELLRAGVLLQQGDANS